jgi:hypothetical protein
MNQEKIRVVLAFRADDQAWIRQSKIAIPKYWEDHSIPPAQGDVIRIAGRQFLVQARVWEHDGETTVLKIFVGNAHAQSDTVFG